MAPPTLRGRSGQEAAEQRRKERRRGLSDGNLLRIGRLVCLLGSLGTAGGIAVSSGAVLRPPLRPRVTMLSAPALAASAGGAAVAPRPPASAPLDALTDAVGCAAVQTSRVLRAAPSLARKTVLRSLLQADYALQSRARSFELDEAGTLAVCACLAGVASEASCAALFPGRFGAVTDWYGAHEDLARRELTCAYAQLASRLAASPLDAYQLRGRVKSVRSVFEKVALRGKDVRDLIGLRVVVDGPGSEGSGIDACYEVRDLVLGLWPDAVVESKDYVAAPKRNGYRSLHISVRTPAGAPLELQIRTRVMHEAAEHGVAAHPKYKATALDAMYSM